MTKHICWSSEQLAIILQQESRNKRFTVTYGKQVKEGLTYVEAAHELGECIFHSLACDGLLDNSGV